MVKGFELRTPTRLVFGPGSLSRLPEVVTGLGKKALIVTGTNSARRTGVLQRVTDLLKKSGIESVAFEKVTPNPLSSTVREGVELVKSESCDFVVGIGGGSPIDTAKAIALCALNEGDILDYQPGGKFAETNPTSSLPVVAVVTTAGTGTEINRYLVITNDETREKPGIGFDCTYPAVGIVDPELMVSVPRDITADTGIDVLYHALEAYVSRGANMFTDLIAKEAIRLVVENLEKAIADGSDLVARSNMAWASTLAGLAIDKAGTVTIHAAAHPISGHLDKPHGQTLAAISVAYMRNNYDADADKFAVLAQLLGQKVESLSTEESAAQSPAALKAFLQKVGRDINLTSLGVTEEMIGSLAQDAFKTMSGALQNNPKEVTPADVEKIYRESLRQVQD